jgi:hypothetical protein
MMKHVIILQLKYYPTICAEVLRKITENLYRTITNVVVRWLALLFHIRDVKTSNLGLGLAIVFLCSSMKVLRF